MNPSIDELEDILPVLDTVLGRYYYNKYCGKCNHINSSVLQVSTWLCSTQVGGSLSVILRLDVNRLEIGLSTLY